MANIKKIEMVQIKRWNGSAWVNMYFTRGGGAETLIETIILYSNETGFDPSSAFTAEVRWDNFNVPDNTGCTIFGASGNMIPVATKAIRIRYKLKTTSAGTPDVEVTTDNYYYQLIKVAFPTTGAFTGLPATATGNINATIAVKCPAFTNDMVPNSATVQSHLSNPNNWRLVWTNPDGVFQEIVPSAATLGTATSTLVAEYGGFYIPVNLTCGLQFTKSGTWTLNIYFYPNDGDTRALLAQNQTCVATITVNMASPQYGTLYAMDNNVSIRIEFTA